MSDKQLTRLALLCQSHEGALLMLRDQAFTTLCGWTPTEYWFRKRWFDCQLVQSLIEEDYAI